MKLSGAQAKRFLARPEDAPAAILCHGPDPSATALALPGLLQALVGADAEAEMRLTRLGASEIRSDPAALIDALKATGFFAGARAVVVDEAGDAIAGPVAAALDAAAPGDAALVLAAGTLAAKSKLRKLIEGAANAVAVPVYADPPGRGEISAALKAAGAPVADEDALRQLEALARSMDAGAFARFVDTLAIYKIGDDRLISAQDIEACAPRTTEAGFDDAIDAAANGRAGEIPRQVGRLAGQGVSATGLAIAAARHFLRLHEAASSPDGPEAALGRMRPPAFGPRRDAMAAQVRRWGAARLEQAIGVLGETDLALRSTSRAPDWPLLERALIRVAMMAPRR